MPATAEILKESKRALLDERLYGVGIGAIVVSFKGGGFFFEASAQPIFFHILLPCLIVYNYSRHLLEIH